MRQNPETIGAYLQTAAMGHKGADWISKWKTRGRRTGVIQMPLFSAEKDTLCWRQNGESKLTGFAEQAGQAIDSDFAPDEYWRWIAVMDIAGYIQVGNGDWVQLTSCRGEIPANEKRKETVNQLENSARINGGVAIVLWDNIVASGLKEKDNPRLAHVSAIKHSAKLSIPKNSIEAMSKNTWWWASVWLQAQTEQPLLNSHSNGAIDWTAMVKYRSLGISFTWESDGVVYSSEENPGIYESMTTELRGFPSSNLNALENKFRRVAKTLT